MRGTVSEGFKGRGSEDLNGGQGSMGNRDLVGGKGL